MKTTSTLVQTATADNLVLSGFYGEGDKAKEAVIFIHGFGGDFYTHRFVHEIADALNSSQYAYVSAQTRGTGLFTELVDSARATSNYKGSYYELLEEAYMDIDAWVEFLQREGYQKIVLLGHSLGTIKSVRYMSEGKHKDVVSKLILLAPFDKNGYVENKTKGEWHEHVKIARQMVDEGRGLEIIPSTFDDFPMTYQTYLSWYQETELNAIWDFYKPDYTSPILKDLHVPVLAVIGDKDDVVYLPTIGGSLDNTIKYLKNNIRSIDVQIVADADHCYVGKEQQVVEVVLKFLE
ncbi:MAG: alpha/beta fold hydrolase [Candidatus Doudnabacteria bacterium]|nr:alpha/beta fold hydrolase [Candidatus Doudnabacteria bacterium]